MVRRHCVGALAWAYVSQFNIQPIIDERRLRFRRFVRRHRLKIHTRTLSQGSRVSIWMSARRDGHSLYVKRCWRRVEEFCTQFLCVPGPTGDVRAYMVFLTAPGEWLGPRGGIDVDMGGAPHWRPNEMGTPSLEIYHRRADDT